MFFYTALLFLTVIAINATYAMDSRPLKFTDSYIADIGHINVALDLFKSDYACAQDSDGNTPLHHFVEKCADCTEHASVHHNCTYEKNKNTVRHLLEHGGSLAALNKNGETPIHIAAELGAGPQYLIQSFLYSISDKQVINEKNSAGFTALDRIILKEYPCTHPFIDVLVAHGATVLSQQTLLKLDIHHDAFHGAYTFVKLAYWHNPAVLNAMPTKYLYKASPLNYATQGLTNYGTDKKGIKKTVAFLLEKQACIASLDDQMNMPLHHAARSKCKHGYKIVRMLLDYGDSCINNENNQGETPLHCAAQTLIRTGECDYRRDIASLLIQRGARVNAKNRHDRTPLHYAITTQNDTMISLLLERGASPIIADDEGDSPLHQATVCIYPGFPTLVTTLLKYNTSNINTQNKKGNTPLHNAVNSCCSNIVELLLQHGAITTIKNVAGETPLDIAKRIPHAKICAMLKKSTATKINTISL